jgi:hypothetical protein
MSKPICSINVGIILPTGRQAARQPVYCCCGIRRIDSASVTQAFTWNVRTSRCNVKRKLQARDTVRRKVSMSSTGAETSVVVMIAIER